MSMEYVNLIKKYRTLLLNAAVVVLSLIFISNMFKSQSLEAKNLKNARESEGKKNEVLANISQLEKKIIAFKNTYSKRDLSQVINTVSNIARDSNIKIVSIKPKKEDNYQAYVKYPFELNIGADSYHAIAKFISKLENYKEFLFFVDSLTLMPVEHPEGEQASRLSVNLVISTISFQN